MPRRATRETRSTSRTTLKGAVLRNDDEDNKVSQRLTPEKRNTKPSPRINKSKVSVSTTTGSPTNPTSEAKDEKLICMKMMMMLMRT
jgi:hypothetical protein